MAGALAGAGAAIAAYDFFTSKGQNLSITDNITTSMLINSTTTVSTDCFSSLSGAQTITVAPGTKTDATSLQTACAHCQNVLTQIYDARISLEGIAASKNGSYTMQEPNPAIKTQMETGGFPSGASHSSYTTPEGTALGACTAVCSDVVLVGVTQTLTLTAKQSCQVQSDITTDVAQSVQGQVTAYLKNQQDIFGQLESAFTSNTQSIAANLATSMSQNVTNSFTEDLTQALYAVQSFNVTGNSVLASNISQSFRGAMIGTMNVTITVNDQLRQSASYSISQSLLNKNDTIGDLSTDFLGVINTMAQMMEQLATQILIIIGAVLAAVMLVVGALYVFNKNFHSWANHSIKTVANAAVAHFTHMQTDPTYRAQVAREKLAAQPADLQKIQAKVSAVATAT